MSYKRILLIGLFIIFFGVILFFSTNYFLEKEKETLLENQTASQPSLEEIAQNKVLYIINKGDEDINKYQAIISPDSTVFSLLKEISERNNFEVSSTLYKDMGIFVESIAGLENGTKGKYWQYWVNDKLGEVAADKKKVKEGDKIEWRFEVPSEF